MLCLKSSPRRLAFCLVLAASCLANLILPSYADVLKGRVEETGKNATPSLKRTDIRPTNNDPFSGTDDDGELLEAPKNAFKGQPLQKPPKAARPFALQATESGAPYNPMAQPPMAAPTDMTGEPDNVPNQAEQQMPPPMMNPQDPDQSPEMQLAWDMWHKRVAQSIFERFNFFAKAAFRRSPPLMAKVSYTVTRDGHIINMNMPQKSTNVLFNVLVFQSIKSLDGDLSILQFPEGSRRMYVPKVGNFTQNYGAEGFRYTVGDRERIQQQQMQQMGGPR